MVAPLLLRGLASGKGSCVRQSSVIIDNMSKLVDDPMDAAPFLDRLLEALTKAADILSDPEARGIAEKAVSQLERLQREVAEAKTRQQHIEHPRVLEAIKKLVKSIKPGKSPLCLCSRTRYFLGACRLAVLLAHGYPQV
jgi:hypothetical protein